MEKMWIIYFTLGAVSMMVGIIIYPYIQQLKVWFVRWGNHKIGFKGQKPLGLIQIELQSLQKKVTELEEQMSNVAKNSYRREQNRKSNIRREVRDYLAELRTKK